MKEKEKILSIEPLKPGVINFSEIVQTQIRPHNFLSCDRTGPIGIKTLQGLTIKKEKVTIKNEESEVVTVMGHRRHEHTKEELVKLDQPTEVVGTNPFKDPVKDVLLRAGEVHLPPLEPATVPIQIFKRSVKDKPTFNWPKPGEEKYAPKIGLNGKLLCDLHKAAAFSVDGLKTDYDEYYTALSEKAKKYLEANPTLLVDVEKDAIDASREVEELMSKHPKGPQQQQTKSNRSRGRPKKSEIEQTTCGEVPIFKRVELIPDETTKVNPIQPTSTTRSQTNPQPQTCC